MLTVAHSSQSPTVLLLITNFDIGGAERVYVHTARALVERGYRVIAACLQRRSGRVAGELSDTSVRIEDLRMRGKFDVAAVVRLTRLLRRERVDVVYTFLIHAHVIGRVAARVAKVPVVLSSQQSAGWETWIQRRLNRITARWCDAVIAVSKGVERYLREAVGIPPEKLVIIYNSVDLDRFPSRGPLLPDPSMPVLGTVARLSPEKDHDTLLEAFAIVHRRYPGARLVLAGAGPERSRLERRVATLDLGGAVQFLGHVEDIARVYRMFDVYLQSSLTEGFSVAILEALASGVPVVATRVGGNEEAVLDGVCGFLVPPRDPQALASAVCRLLDHPAECRLMGDRGRRHVAQMFGKDAAVSRTEALVTRALASRTDTRPA